MNSILSNKSYLQFSRSILAMAAMLALVVFAVISYHRIMIGMHTQPDGMSHAASQASNDCLALCITTASVSWTQLLVVMQQTFVGSLSLLVSVFIAALLLVRVCATALPLVQPSRVIRLLLYAKQRWKFKLLCLWSRLLQQGIIAPRLYA